jgi:hypothetical protein
MRIGLKPIVILLADDDEEDPMLPCDAPSGASVL